MQLGRMPTVRPCAGCARRRAKINQGLGWITEAIGAASSLLDSGGGGSGGASPASSPITVNPNIQVSPQISPVFQQSFQPSNSPMTAGTSQSLPGMGAPGYDNGSGGGLPPLNNSIPMPSTLGGQTWQKYVPWAIGGVVALFAIKVFGDRNRGRNAN